MMGASLELFHKHIQSIRHELDCMIDQSENNRSTQELNLAIEQLNSYETVINQQFQLLISIDPSVDDRVLNSVIIKINGLVTVFKESFVTNKQSDKFINYLPIENYTV